MELLAPCGNLNTFYVAVGSGANAVYLGLKDFSARKSADNFSYEELEKAVAYARVMGVKVYVALNTLVKDDELDRFFNAVERVREIGVDAIILQDLFLGKFLSENLPDLELHFSTQGGINNLEGAIVAKEHGFKRVILARETPLSEIKKIASFIDTEVFVQGALCTSFSGHCYMSSFAGGNSGNRGLCKQPCRRTYKLGGGEENYAICTADLSVGERIKDYESIGVKSLKIEGRMRRAEYVSASLNYYRSILYPWEKEGGELSALKRTYNRGNYTKGLSFGQDGNFLSTLVQGHIGERVGVVNKIMGSKLFVNGNLNLTKGDGFKLLRKGKEVGSADFNGEKGKGYVVLNSKGKIEVGDEVYVTTDVRLNRALVDVHSCRIIDVKFRAEENENAVVEVFADGNKIAEARTSDTLPTASGKPLLEEQVKEIFDKVDNYPFAVGDYDIEILGRPFGVKSVLNALRREAYLKAYESLSYKEKLPPQKLVYQPKECQTIGKAKAVIGEHFEGLEGYDIAIFAPSDYNDARFFQKFFDYTKEAKERYLYLPSLLYSGDIEIIKSRIQDFDGIYGENPHAIYLAREWGKKLFLGCDFNLFNALSLDYAMKVADHVSFSKELSEKEMLKTGRSKGAFKFTRGDIKVMELGYCPYGKKCSKCKAPTLNTLTDYAGRKFILRRIKLSRCYFEIYNPMELIFEEGELSLYNLVLHKGDMAKKRMEVGPKEYREIAKETTSGHFKNPVE